MKKMKAKKLTLLSTTCPSYKMNTGRLRRKSFKGPENGRKAQERGDRDMTVRLVRLLTWEEGSTGVCRGSWREWESLKV